MLKPPFSLFFLVERLLLFVESGRDADSFLTLPVKLNSSTSYTADWIAISFSSSVKMRSIFSKMTR